MADFTPINTQEELNAIIGERLEQARNAERKKFADYDEVKTQLAGLQKDAAEKDKTIADLQGQLKSSRSDLAKTRIALEKGLPMELCNRLNGDTEEELQKDAETLSKLLQNARSDPPRFDPDNNGGGKDEALRSLLTEIKKQ